MTQRTSPAYALARRVAELFADLPRVEAVALAGSQVVATPDANSDIDLYVYTNAEIPLAERRAIVAQSGGASEASLGLDYWGPGDEWFHAGTGIEVDVVYFSAQWMANEMHQVVEEHRASLGYTTSLWHTIRQSRIFHDPNRWLLALQMHSHHSYPEALRHNIVALNHPVLRNVIPAYANQLEKAVKRHDLLSVNHRLAALFASYFDVVYAVNRTLHPGEKRLVANALARCDRLPTDMAIDIEAVMQASGTGDATLIERLTRLLDHLDELLVAEGFEVGHAESDIS